MLDTLLADPRLAIEALSGTSAGAINAVALADGWSRGLARKGDRHSASEAARQGLAGLWEDIGHWGALGAMQARFAQTLWGSPFAAQWAHANMWAQALNGLFSPYQTNPLRRSNRPDDEQEILDRMNELKFNASLLAQMRGIDRINRLLADGALVGGGCKPVRLHRIDGGPALLAYSAASKTDPDPGLRGRRGRLPLKLPRSRSARPTTAGPARTDRCR